MATESTALDALYRSANKLSDAHSKLAVEKIDTFKEYTADFQNMLDNAKVGPKTKILSLQILPKNLVHFPELADSALDILIDLFEENEKFRIKAVEGFKVVASSASGPVISKLVGVLLQLLQTEDEQELVAVNAALVAALTKDVDTTLTALFEQINADEQSRPKVLTFLTKELIPRANEILNRTSDTPSRTAEIIRKQLTTKVTPAEFGLLMKIAFNLDVFKTGEVGAKELLDIHYAYFSYDSAVPFTASEDETNRLLQCTGSIRLLFNHGAPADKVMGYICKTVLPKFDDLTPGAQLSLLKNVAEIAPHVKGPCCRECLPCIYALLFKLVPDEAPTPAGGAAEGTEADRPRTNWSAVECVLYAFHHYCDCVPGFLHSLCGIKINTGHPENRLDEDFTAKRAELTRRMAALAKQCDAYVKKLNQVAKKLADMKPENDAERKEQQGKKEACAASLKTCGNVGSMAGALRKPTPVFLAGKMAVALSWKKPAAGAGRPASAAAAAVRAAQTPAAKQGGAGAAAGGAAAAGSAEKRKAEAPAAAGGNQQSKKQRGDIQIYRPGQGGSLRGGGGGGGRGRGRGGRR